MNFQTMPFMFLLNGEFTGSFLSSKCKLLFLRIIDKILKIKLYSSELGFITILTIYLLPFHPKYRLLQNLGLIAVLAA